MEEPTLKMIMTILHMYTCTVHKTPSHTVIRLTHMNALWDKHYLLFMDKEAEALER